MSQEFPVRSILVLPLLLALACNESTNNANGSNTPMPSAQAASPGASELPDPVAVVAGEPITRADLEEKAAPEVMAAMQQLHEARSKALEGLIVDRLLEAAAKKAGTDVEGLLKTEVEAKVAVVDDAAVEAFYNENSARMPGPLDAMKDRIRQHLDGQGKGERMQAYIEELKAAAKVETFLEPFRLNVAPRQGAAIKGKAGAPVHIVEFSDFQCPYCTRGAATVEEVVAAYGDKVSFEYRHFPLNFHDRARRAAEASECANDQGKFWAYHDLLFANQSALQEPDLENYATQAALDLEGFRTCMSSGKHAATVDADMAAGAAVGMQGTPGFFVNGRVLSGAQPLPAFKEIIDAELKAKGLL
jgi:protein-disulfide isomerase